MKDVWLQKKKKPSKITFAVENLSYCLIFKDNSFIKVMKKKSDKIYQEDGRGQYKTLNNCLLQVQFVLFPSLLP